MADHRAITAISKALLRLLKTNEKRAGIQDDLKFALYEIKDFMDKPAIPLTIGLSLLLYRVEVNGALRNMGPRGDAEGKLYRPALTLDLHYMLTPWSSDGGPETQQRLLGWAMSILDGNSSLPANFINEDFLAEGQGAVFEDNETVQILAEPLSFQDYLTLWDKLKPNMQISATYVARLVQIRSALTVDAAKPVQTRDL